MDETFSRKPVVNRWTASSLIIIGLALFSLAVHYRITSKVQSLTSTAWKRQVYGDVSLEFPFQLIENREWESSITDADRQLITELKVYDSLHVPGVAVSVTRTVYRDGIEVDLDENVHGWVRSASSFLRSELPKYEIHPVIVDGYDGRKTSVKLGSDIGITQSDYLAFGRDNRVWQVTVMHRNGVDAVAAGRIFDSVRVVSGQ